MTIIKFKSNQSDKSNFSKFNRNRNDIKKVFFDLLPPKALALSNTDDKNVMYMMQNTKSKKNQMY